MTNCLLCMIEVPVIGHHVLVHNLDRVLIVRVPLRMPDELATEVFFAENLIT